MSAGEDESRRDVYALLKEARRYGIGVMFGPDFDDDGNEAEGSANSPVSPSA